MTARASTVTLHEGVRERLVAMRDKAGESLICIPTATDTADQATDRR